MGDYNLGLFQNKIEFKEPLSSFEKDELKASVLHREFKTIEEHDAYLTALKDASEYLNIRVLTAEEVKKINRMRI